MSGSELVLGADVGGTTTRVGVATLAGKVLGVAVGGPGNPNSVGPAASAAQIRSVVAAVLADRPGRVTAVVLGLAGGSRVAADPDFLRAVLPDQVPARAVLVSDLVVAFCSATPATDGCVLVAGTGAVAGQVRGAELIQQRDGWGWLVGDHGSGFWLGRAAVRATLDSLQRGSALGPLQRDVLSTAAVQGYHGLLDACYRSDPVELARFAPLVSRHAEHDPVASAIADEAVTRLWQLLSRVDRRAGEPVVLAGSVLAPDGPVGRGLRRRLAQLPDVVDGRTEVLSSAGGVVGALWLALRSRGVTDGSVHQRLTRGVGRAIGAQQT